MSDLIESIEYKGYKINIYPDHDADDPRNWDNLGLMVCFHRDYDLGDKHEFTPESLMDYVKQKNVIALPLYLLDHSGLWMRTERFGCDPGGWDTSFVGYIVCDYKTIKKEYSCKRVTKDIKKQVLKVLESEIKTYSLYLEGGYVGYTITDSLDDDDILDSCWGFDDSDYMIQECKSIIDSYKLSKKDLFEQTMGYSAQGGAL
jgi:hypothetical protein